MERAIETAETKYPKQDGWRHVWVFDHSSCHAAMADDALDVTKMNVKPGGKQRIMRDTVWKIATKWLVCCSRNINIGISMLLTRKSIVITLKESHDLQRGNGQSANGC